MSTESQTHSEAPTKGHRRFFSVEQANQALPYVARVTKDIRTAYREAIALHDRMEQASAEQPQAMRQEYEQTIERLHGYVDELADVGVELKDYEIGLVDFPAMHDGREICLCWRSGEQQIVAWHEVHTGFAGRQDVTCLTESCDH